MDFVKLWLYMYFVFNFVVELWLYSYFILDVFDEYLGYYGFRKFLMKIFWFEVNKKMLGLLLLDGDGDSLGVCLKKILDFLW